MTSLATTLRRTGRAAVLALVLAGTAMTAMPAQAAPLKNFQLELQLPKEEKGLQFKKVDPNKFFNWCLTDKQIRKGLKNLGFYEVDIVAHLGKNRVRVEAAWDEWVYSMRIHRCSGEVDKIKKLYPIWDEEDDDFPF